MGNGNDDISSEEHFENSKISRDSYFYAELFIFVHIFEFYCEPMPLTIIFAVCKKCPYAMLQYRATLGPQSTQ
jgi:hypothetical protein